jgi:hypothetical protein
VYRHPGWRRRQGVAGSSRQWRRHQGRQRHRRQGRDLRRRRAARQQGTESAEAVDRVTLSGEVEGEVEELRSQLLVRQGGDRRRHP